MCIRDSQILVRLHFLQAADGALKLEFQLLAGVEFQHRRGGGQDQLDAAIIELVHQVDEAPRLILHLPVQHRYVGDEDGVKAAGDFDVVGGAARPVADRPEAEPDDDVGLAQGGDEAALDLQIAAAMARLGRDRCV